MLEYEKPELMEVSLSNEIVVKDNGSEAASGCITGACCYAQSDDSVWSGK